jgi:preprotein translocase subunit YajC
MCLHLRGSFLGVVLPLLTASVARAEAGGTQGNLLGMLMPLGLFVVIFYFLIIRPQKKKQRKHDDMLSSIRRGDQVVSAGGFYGTVKEVKDDSFIVEIAEGVKVRILKASISMKRSSEEEAPQGKSPKKTDSPEQPEGGEVSAKGADEENK